MRTSVPFCEVESVGHSFRFSVCAPAVPPSVPVVTVPVSNVDAVCEVVSPDRIVNLVNRRPFLSPENAKCVLAARLLMPVEKCTVEMTEVDRLRAERLFEAWQQVTPIELHTTASSRMAALIDDTDAKRRCVVHHIP